MQTKRMPPAEQRINYLLIRLLKDYKKRHNNLSMEWIDYKKAYDFVPHSWITECMELFGIADKVRNFSERVWNNGSSQNQN